MSNNNTTTEVTTVYYDYINTDWVIWNHVWGTIFIISGISIPIMIFVCCCRYNRMYRKLGPFSDLPDDTELCPSGDRCFAARHIYGWCCRRRQRKPTSGSSAPTGPDDDTAAVFVISEQVDATRYVLPPPAYDAALSMRRPKGGEIVRFVSGSGSDGVLFEFSMPSSGKDRYADDATGCRVDDNVEDCDPPVYCWPAAWSYMQGDSDGTVVVEAPSPPV